MPGDGLDLARRVAGILAWVLLCSTAGPAIAQQAPPGWIVDQRSGCKAWDAQPQPDESMSWSGACPQGVAQGKGTQRWFISGKPTDTYIGELRDGKHNGRGVYTWASGARYDGEWLDGQRSGRGLYIAANGHRYEGEFRDDYRNGRGVSTYADGSRYDGEWRDGKRHGRGVYIWANRDRYDGEWRDGRRNGRGLYTPADGTPYDGQWRDDKLVEQ